MIVVTLIAAKAAINVEVDPAGNPGTRGAVKAHRVVAAVGTDRWRDVYRLLVVNKVVGLVTPVTRSTSLTALPTLEYKRSSILRLN